jgi:hypothetical protein
MHLLSFYAAGPVDPRYYTEGAQNGASLDDPSTALSEEMPLSPLNLCQTSRLPLLLMGNARYHLLTNHDSRLERRKEPCKRIRSDPGYSVARFAKSLLVKQPQLHLPKLEGPVAYLGPRTPSTSEWSLQPKVGVDVPPSCLPFHADSFFISLTKRIPHIGTNLVHIYERNVQYNEKLSTTFQVFFQYSYVAPQCLLRSSVYLSEQSSWCTVHDPKH